MKCLVGLGNPGRNYAAHRHNFGFMVVDYILKHTSLDFHNRRMEHGQIWRSSEVMLAKPETFMNLSGQAVSELLRYTPVETDQLLIAYDDVSLDFGQLRIRKQGSAGSHNGMKSVIQSLGSNTIPRLRLGIGPKPTTMELADYVLAGFSRSEQHQLPEILALAERAFYTWLNQGLDQAMNLFNQRTTQPTPFTPNGV